MGYNCNTNRVKNRIFGQFNCGREIERERVRGRESRREEEEGEKEVRGMVVAWWV